MNYWEGPARWINTLLLIIVGFVGLDTLFQLLGALEDNAIVRLVRFVAGIFLAPFEGMFEDQEFLLTAVIAVLGYSLLAGIALAVYRSIQSSRGSRQGPAAPPATPGFEGQDETRPL
jgi:hypothetical protein